MAPYNPFPPHQPHQNCSYCNKKGAALGCANRACDKTYHVLCAAQQGSVFDAWRHVERKGGLFCARHSGMDAAVAAVPAKATTNPSNWIVDLQQAMEEERTEGTMRLPSWVRAGQGVSLSDAKPYVARTKGHWCYLCRWDFVNDEIKHNADDDPHDDVMPVHCTGCGILAHPECLGVGRDVLIRAITQPGWRCWYCKQGDAQGQGGAYGGRCALCKVEEAMPEPQELHTGRVAVPLQTVDEAVIKRAGRFLPAQDREVVRVHTACALWLPNTMVQVDISTMRVSGLALSGTFLDKPPEEQASNHKNPSFRNVSGASCAGCGSNEGAVVACCHPRCNTVYHPPCAMKARVYTEQHPCGQVVFCNKHAPDQLWCVCNRLSRDVAMVRCNRCFDWLHYSCVGTTEDTVKTSDDYVCPACGEEHTHTHTVCALGLCHGLPVRVTSALPPCSITHSTARQKGRVHAQQLEKQKR